MPSRETAPVAAGGDYLSTSGTLTIGAGSTSAAIAVTINGDTAIEPSETFTLILSNASGATITDAVGFGTIVTDDAAFTFTDSPLSPGTPIKTAHIAELRSAVNTLRAAKGLPAFIFTDATLTAGSNPIKGAHITELRSALAAVYTTAGQPVPTYTEPTLIVVVTMKAAHITELRERVLNAP